MHRVELRRACLMAHPWSQTFAEPAMCRMSYEETEAAAAELMARGGWYVLAAGVEYGPYNAVIRVVYGPFETADYLAMLRSVAVA